MSTLRVWTAFLRMKFYSIKILTVKNLTAKLYNSDSNSMAFSMALRSRSKKWLKDRPVILTSRPGLRRRRRLSADRLPVHQSTLDQEYHFEVDEWTDFWRWTVRLTMYGNTMKQWFLIHILVRNSNNWSNKGALIDNRLNSHFSFGIISNTVFWIESAFDDYVKWTDLDDGPWQFMAGGRWTKIWTNSDDRPW